jgi:uncharacterized protein YuzE
MNIRNDPATDSLYIHLSNRSLVDANQVKERVLPNADASGALLGIDFQHASQRADINNLSVSRLPLGRLQAA